MMENAPIALFVYNRPQHTINLLNSLAKNKEAANSILFVFSDGAKPGSSDNDLEKINKVREIIDRENRFKEVIIKNSIQNLGLANSIIQGVTSVLNRYDSIIVLEDDLIVSPYFLSFMNDSLIKYCDNIKVGQIGACNFFACGKKYPETFFLPIPDCLGWATWKNRWGLFNSDAVELLRLLKLDQNRMFNFNANGAYNFQGMLEDQIEKKVDSWAIRWQATCILNDLLILYPNPSLTNHIASLQATHANVNITPPLANVKLKNLEIDTEVNKRVLKAMIRGYSNSGNYFGTVKIEFFRKKIRRILIDYPISLIKNLIGKK